jgi:ribose 5-phosphate isomerase A
MISSKQTIRLLRVSLFATTCLVPKYESGSSGERESREVAARARGQAGATAVDKFVKSGMIVGLGTGNTIFFTVERLGALVKDKQLKDITVCAVNSVTEHHCSELNIPVISINNISPAQTIDVMIDSADEVDMQLNVLKGAKGSLSRERYST